MNVCYSCPFISHKTWVVTSKQFPDFFISNFWEFAVLTVARINWFGYDGSDTAGHHPSYLWWYLNVQVKILLSYGDGFWWELNLISAISRFSLNLYFHHHLNYSTNSIRFEWYSILIEINLILNLSFTDLMVSIHLDFEKKDEKMF